MRELRADIGIALDGDADRLILVDERGNLVDGDQLMALIATQWHAERPAARRRHRCHRHVQSRPGALSGEPGSRPAAHPVGDRYVVEHMRAKGCNVGGEQSGHIVLSDFGTTGDGLVAALQVMAAVKLSDKPVSQVIQLFTPLPQVQRNVRYGEFNPLDTDGVRKAIAEAMSRLDQNGGRLLVRPSGTEPLIRVMAEGEDPSLIGKLVDELVSLIEKEAA